MQSLWPAWSCARWWPTPRCWTAAALRRRRPPRGPPASTSPRQTQCNRLKEYSKLVASISNSIHDISISGPILYCLIELLSNQDSKIRVNWQISLTHLWLEYLKNHDFNSWVTEIDSDRIGKISNPTDSDSNRAKFFSSQAAVVPIPHISNLSY